MRLDQYITKARIVDLASDTLEGALKELLAVTAKGLKDGFDPKQIESELLEREHNMSTYLGNGVLMPHIRVKMKRRYLFAIGRCPRGLVFEGQTEYKQARLLFLLLASEGARDYLNVLASIARLFREQAVVEKVVEPSDTKEFQQRVLKVFSGSLAEIDPEQAKFNKLILRSAERTAKESKCNRLVVFGDAFTGGFEAAVGLPSFPTVLVARSASDILAQVGEIKAVIEVRSFTAKRLAALRSALLIGLTRGIFKNEDRLCCVGGVPGSNRLDTVAVIDVQAEFQSLLTKETDLLPPNVRLEVVERLLSIATELSVEGREGKPMGALFVLGDTAKVGGMVKPLLLNPFHGYKEEDRNVLNPFMDETIKELSSIDGAFIIRGNGTIESAGSMVHPPSEFYHNLPGGLGTRHAAAAAVSLAADCVAIVVSSSTGQVTLFRRGVMIPILDRSSDKNV